MNAQPLLRRYLVGVGLTTLALGACTRDSPHGGQATPPPGSLSPEQMTAPQGAPPATAPAAPPSNAAAAPADNGGLSGTVVETMNSGGYTYAKLDHGTRPVWVAGPETKLAVGTVIGSVNGTLMSGFRSNTLNRTFDEIYFINDWPVAGSAPPNPHAGVAGAPPADGKPADGKPAPAMTEKLEPAAGGQTIAQVFAGKDALVGKPVVVRGKVVKLNNGILGKNWLHIQDGSGKPGTNDLTVTTDATTTLGDVVVVRGVLAKDKDFGAGYKYDVLVENATLAAK